MKLWGRTLVMLTALTAPAVRGEELRLEGNAALQYWQAFSLLSADTEKKLDATDLGADVPRHLNEWLGDDNTLLEYLHAGAAMTRCDWGVDLRKGPQTLLPHLSRARYLAKVALLRACLRFEQGRPREAIEDVLATLELAKDVGDTPVLLSLLVRYGIEDMAIAAVARHVPTLDRAALDHLAEALEPLPADDSLKRVWPAQSQYMIDWAFEQVGRIEREVRGDSAMWAEGLLELRKVLGGDDNRLRALADNVPRPEQLRATLQACKEMLAQLEDATDLPAAEQDARLGDILQPLRTDPVAQILVSDPKKAFHVRRRWQTRHALLDAAVAVAREGEGALNDKRFADPFGDGGSPFEFRKTDGGFEMRSKLMDNDKPVSLLAGKAAPPRPKS